MLTKLCVNSFPPTLNVADIRGSMESIIVFVDGASNPIDTAIIIALTVKFSCNTILLFWPLRLMNELIVIL